MTNRNQLKRAPVRGRGVKQIAAKAPVTLESFSMSGNVGGLPAFRLASGGSREVQNILVNLPRGQQLVLDAGRFFLTNPNLRLRIRVSDARNPNDPVFPDRIVTSLSPIGQISSRTILRNDVTNLARLRVRVYVIARGNATVNPSDGWSLHFLIRTF